MPAQSSQFTYTTLADAKAQLAAKLNDPNGVFWTSSELTAYIVEGLRWWNVLTSYWAQEYAFTLTPPLSSSWLSLSNTSTGPSPRAQSLTLNDLYVILCFHLMERSVTNLTGMFTADDFTTAAQTVRDEILQKTASSITVINTNITPSTNRVYLPDTTLDIRRVRYTGAASKVSTTLVKGDSNSFLRFSPTYRQTISTPTRYDILGSPPLALTLDFAPNEPNSIEVLAITAGATIASPASPLGIPNDWLPVLKWGVLYELLSKEAESTDHQRANYAEKRYQEGLRAISTQPWLLTAALNNVAVDIPSVIGKDRFSLNWQSDPSSWPSVVVGGVDLVAIAPTPTTTTGVTLTLVGNAPIPATDADFLEVPRDVLNSLLDYAQHLAAWKIAGDEAEEGETNYRAFIECAMMANDRLRESGIFATDLRPSTSRQELSDPRFADTK